MPSDAEDSMSERNEANRPSGRWWVHRGEMAAAGGTETVKEKRIKTWEKNTDTQK